MKKILFIWILSLVACKKTAVIPTPQPNVKIFDVRESSVENGQEIEFDLTKSIEESWFLGLFLIRNNPVKL